MSRSDGARSKQKGAAFEREVCKRLSLWVSHGAKEDCFWRSAMSGGRATIAARSNRNLSAHAGDITAISPEGFQLADFAYIECKFYRDLRVSSFVVLKRGTLQGFWRATVKAARRHDKTPMMIVKENNMPALVITSIGSLQVLTRNSRIDSIVAPERNWEMCFFDDLTSLRFRFGAGLTDDRQS